MLAEAPSSELTPAQQALLRRYRRLWIGQQDLREAEAAIRQILLLRLRRSTRKRGYHPLLTALNVAVLVSYSRPFVNSRGSSRLADKILPGQLLRSYSRDERQLHDQLLAMRNHEVAHSDPEVLGLQLQLVQGGDVGFSRIPREPLTRIELRRLGRMIHKLQNAIADLCADLRQQLPPHHWF